MPSVTLSLEKLGEVDTSIGNAVLVFREISENGLKETVLDGTWRMLTKYGTTSKSPETIGVLGIPWRLEKTETENQEKIKFTYYGQLIVRGLDVSRFGLIQKADTGKLGYFYVGCIGEKFYLFLEPQLLPASLADGLRARGRISQ